MKSNRRGSASALFVIVALAVIVASCGPQSQLDEANQSRPAAAVLPAAPPVSAALAAAPTCSPTGAHAKHGSPIACTTCHLCAGSVTFDPAGPAYAATGPAPVFDAATKTCNNVACHGVYSGSYTWDFWGNVRTMTYSNTGKTPSWYAAGSGCGTCHGNSPKNPVNWHAGGHLGGNACETCHPDAVSQNDVGVAISTANRCGPYGNQPCAPFHRDGKVLVQPAWDTACYDCH